MNEEKPAAGGKFEMESEDERKRRSRSERMRKWRKEMRRSRESELDDGTDLPIPRHSFPL